jgi:hypothetical protein
VATLKIGRGCVLIPRMPAEYTIDAARGIVFTRGFGVITDDELREHASSLKRDPQFQPSFRQFVDFSEVTEVEVTAAGVGSILGRSNPFPPDAVRAILAPDPTTFGLSRIFEARHDASAMLVTRSREEAEQHVGLAAGASLR